MANNLTVHITKDKRQYIIVPKVGGKGTKKSYGYFGVAGKDFTNYVIEGKKKSGTWSVTSKKHVVRRIKTAKALKRKVTKKR